METEELSSREVKEENERRGAFNSAASPRKPTEKRAGQEGNELCTLNGRGGEEKERMRIPNTRFFMYTVLLLSFSLLSGFDFGVSGINV